MTGNKFNFSINHDYSTKIKGSQKIESLLLFNKIA